MRHARIQRVHQRGTFLKDPNPRVAMAMNPPLVTLGPTEPPRQFEIVFDLFHLGFAYEQAREDTDHHSGHVLVNHVLGALAAIAQLLVLLLATRLPPLSD